MHVRLGNHRKAQAQIADRASTAIERALVERLARDAFAPVGAVSFVAQRGGAIDLLLPCGAREQVRAALTQMPGGARRAVIEERPISAAEIATLRRGARLLLNRQHDEPIDAECNKLLVLRSRIAEKDGRIVLHVDERRIAEDWPA